MRRGTTPTVTIKITGISVDLLSTIFVTFKQGQKEVTKDNQDTTIDVDSNSLKVSLTQEETLLFQKGQVGVQIRAKTISDDAIASQIVYKQMEDILYEGEI